MSYQDNECPNCTESRMCPEHEIELLEWEIMHNQDRIEELKNGIQCERLEKI